MEPVITKDEVLTSIYTPEGGTNFIGAMAKSDAVIALDGSNDSREPVKKEIRDIALDVSKEVFEDDEIKKDLDKIQDFYNDAFFAGAMPKDVYEEGIQRVQGMRKDRILVAQGEERPLGLWRESRDLFVKGKLSAEGYLELQSKLQQKSVDFFMYEMSIKTSTIRVSDPKLFGHYKDLTRDMAKGLMEKGIINYVQFTELLKFAENDMVMDTSKKDSVYKEFDPILKKLGVIQSFQ